MTREDMKRHAQEWIAAWNRRDLEAVLAPFAEDAVFVSPRAEGLTGHATVKGKEALRRYWTEALKRAPDLKFTLLSVLCDVKSGMLLVSYMSQREGKATRACELMRFQDRRQIYGEAFYGASGEAVRS